MRALVPFGQRSVTGYILGESAEMDLDSVKCILDILDESPLFPASMIPFFEWISDYYLYPLGQVIQSALPGGLTRKDVTCYTLTPAGKRHLADASLPALQQAVLRLLEDRPRTVQGHVRIRRNPHSPFAAAVHGKKRMD